MVTIFSDIDGDNYYLLGKAGDFRSYGATKFTPSESGCVTSITIWLKAASGYANIAVRAALRADNEGEPSNSTLELSNSVAAPTDNGVWYAFDLVFTGDTILTAGTYYWLVLYRTDSQTTNVSYRTKVPGGNPGRYDGNGVAPWTAYTFTINALITGTAVTTEYSQDVAGAITPTGLILRRVEKAFASSITPTGLILRGIQKTFAGSITLAGVLVRTIQKLFVGSTLITGSLSHVITTVVAKIATRHATLRQRIRRK